jgi:D-sedoheptulose 7-phosphate isomerase
MQNQIENLITRKPELAACRKDIEAGYELLHGCYRTGGKVLVCGNGGSAADSEHIVGELMKGFMHPRPVPRSVRQALGQVDPDFGSYLADHLQQALPAISLVSQVSLITAFANDVAPDMIFAQQVYGYGCSGDVLIALSTAGRAPSILNALKVARAIGLRTLGFTAAGGGRMPAVCDVLIRAPFEGTPEAQEAHISIYHTLCAMLEEAFFGTGEPSRSSTQLHPFFPS